MIKKQEKPIGLVVHYFSNINVAVIKLLGNLKTGDVIRIKGGENTDFEQEVFSIELDHKKVKTAKKGQSVGMKVSKKVREGYKIYKV
jgi:putative protease